MSDGQDMLELGDERQEGRVEDYKFEPIKGYPMLNWRGKRPFTSTQFYPAQLKEVHGADVDGWRNKIFWGDNLQVMSHLLKDFRGKIDLVYIDPPFDSKADYKKTITIRGSKSQSDYSAFEEKQYTDIWTNDSYLQFMYERIVLCKELIADGGAFYLHCDWRKSHMLRSVCDEIFGANNFKNEISWIRASSHNDTSGRYGRLKDTILFYSKGKPKHFKIQYLPYSAEYIDAEWRKLDSGRYYKCENMLDPRGSMAMFDFHGTSARWRTSPEKMEALWKAPQTEVPGSHGRIKLGKNGKPIKRCRIVFLDELEGVPLGDVWDDIPYLAGGSKESWGYPTQKPEKLLERIINSSSQEGDIVFDFFMGSGTTLSVAQNLGRRFVGSDINLGAIQVASSRIIEKNVKNDDLYAADDFRNAGFSVENINNYDFFRNPIQAKDILIEALEIQSLQADALYDGEKDGRVVKIMPVNRIATKADLVELVAGFDQKVFQRRQDEKPNQPVEKITLVCMGHEPDLKAELELQAKPFRIDVEVLDVLRDNSELELKRDAEAKLGIHAGELVIENFYPMNLLQKLSLQQEQVGEWRELVDSVMVDWNYDGAVLQPAVVDVPAKDKFVLGRYKVPADAGTIRVKITDLLSESWEGNIDG